jgi:hypothetical protein
VTSPKNFASRRKQRGATLIVALIMIALITLLVVNAFTLSSSNLKAVSNMQMRDETVAAANQAIERVLATDFHIVMGTQTFNVDINKDGTNDYAVNTTLPVCIRAAIATAGTPSETELLEAGFEGGADWNVDFEIKATVTDSATGARATVTQGVRKLMPQIQKETSCP